MSEGHGRYATRPLCRRESNPQCRRRRIYSALDSRCPSAHCRGPESNWGSGCFKPVCYRCTTAALEPTGLEPVRPSCKDGMLPATSRPRT